MPPTPNVIPCQHVHKNKQQVPQDLGCGFNKLTLGLGQRSFEAAEVLYRQRSLGKEVECGGGGAWRLRPRTPRFPAESWVHLKDPQGGAQTGILECVSYRPSRQHPWDSSHQESLGRESHLIR